MAVSSKTTNQVGITKQAAKTTWLDGAGTGAY